MTERSVCATNSLYASQNDIEVMWHSICNVHYNYAWLKVIEQREELHRYQIEADLPGILFPTLID